MTRYSIPLLAAAAVLLATAALASPADRAGRAAGTLAFPAPLAAATGPGATLEPCEIGEHRADLDHEDTPCIACAAPGPASDVAPPAPAGAPAPPGCPASSRAHPPPLRPPIASA